LKLPKGIKKMRAAGSEVGLSNALKLATGTGFNGYLRTTAPKGVKEASVILFIDGSSRLAVFQSPQRSLYGADALHEVKRIAYDPKSIIRVEEFLAQNMDEVKAIVKKMRKAEVEIIDIERVLMGIDVEVEEEKTEDQEMSMDAITAAIESELDEEETEQVAPDVPEKEEPAKDQKVGAVRAKVTERITRSQEAAVKDDDEFLRMIKEAGMSPPGENEPVDDEVNQYIAAFEDFIQRTGDEEEDLADVDVTVELTNAVDDILDDMLEVASDDPKMIEFIESQRERILTKVATMEPTVTAKERHDRLTEQQMALDHISITFKEVLEASQSEAERRRKELEERRKSGDAEDELQDGDNDDMEEAAERHTGIQAILGRVMDTHRERLDGAEMDMFDEEAEAKANEMAKEAEAKQELDLEGAKEEFLDEMRSRIQSVSTGEGEAPKPGTVTKAVHGVSEDIQDKVEDLEVEKKALTKERKVLEDETSALQEKVDTISVDMEVEVQARLRDLEQNEADLEKRSKDSKELERRLENERSKVEKDLDHARTELDRVVDMEKNLKEREDILASREKELNGKHREVDGLKEHLEEEIARRAAGLEDLELKLKTQEKVLLAKDNEITASLEAVKKEREEGVEADLGRVREVEEELRKREGEYSATITNLEAIIEALQDELRENIGNLEGLETQLKALHETEEKVKELEERLASVPESSEGASDMDKEELRKLLSYLDDLLSKLPEKEIEKFSKTEYFELYGRILDRLGI
jgi:predicted  nucleic acid-binding Zn-ribbon protein